MVICASPHTTHCLDGSSKPWNWMMLPRSPIHAPFGFNLSFPPAVSTLIPSITTSPAAMAFVVAIAWMMFPAMPLTAKRDSVGIPYMCIRRLAVAATKSMAMSSSLSNVALPIISLRSVMKRLVVERNSLTFSSRPSTFWSRNLGLASDEEERFSFAKPSADFVSPPAVAAFLRISSRSNGFGGDLDPQSFSFSNTFFTSS
mmetsp:Transcript_24574/g.34333  ORF Transcript_24574/g.34333 Transcript_24574/m.34333 type:complete len:201 (-) Transcript_24574:40-642(-)